MNNIFTASIHVRTSAKTWVGNTLFLDPPKLPIDANIEAITDSVPVGGTLHLMNDYDVSRHGPLALEKGITIKGSGWGKDGNSLVGGGGTKIINMTDAVPNAITFIGPLTDDNPSYFPRQCNIRDLSIEHTGSAAAILYKNLAHGEIARLRIDLKEAGQSGIELANAMVPAFHNVIYVYISNCFISNFTKTGVWFNNIHGSKNSISSCRIQSAFAKSGVECSAKDILIENSQIQSKAGPGILLNATDALGYDITGVIIRNVLSESLHPMVKAVSDGTHKIHQLQIKNPILTASDVNRIFFDLDYTEDSKIETPLSYGVTRNAAAYLAPLGIFRENSKNNLLTVMGRHASLPYTELGKNNLVRIEHASAIDVLAANQNFPFAGVQHVPLETTTLKALVRSPKTTQGGASNVWQPAEGQSLLSPPDIQGLELYLEADSLENMFQDTNKMEVVSSDKQSVLVWEDSTGKDIAFSTDEKVAGIVTGATTTLNVTSYIPTLAKPGDTVTISNVKILSGPNINKQHTVIERITDYSFIISFDSTGAQYDLSDAVTTIASNMPIYHANVLGSKVPGVYFDGSLTQMTGPAIALGKKTATILVVATPVDLTENPMHILGRYWGTERIAVRNLSGKYNTTAFFAAKAVSTTARSPISRGAVFIAARTNGQVSTINYTTSDKVVNAGADINFLRDSLFWQLGNSTGNLSYSFKGYIHSVAMFSTELSDDIVKQLAFQAINKYRGLVSYD